MIETTIAYFPLLKVMVTLFLVLLLYYTAKTKRKKSMIAVILIMAIITIYSPIKYDGTNTNEYSRKNVRETTQIKESVKQEKIESKQLTFSQRMKLESQRELSENLKIQQEINK